MHLDSCVIPDLAREEGRLYNHYSVISRHPRTLVQRNQIFFPDATVLQMSPLLTAELADWMLLLKRLRPRPFESLQALLSLWWKFHL